MLINKIKAFRKLPGIIHFRRWYNHFRSDVALISFPKSGRTWLRVMIGRALQKYYDADENIIMETTAIYSLDSRLPNLNVSHDEFAQDKSPEEISWDKRKYTSKRVIFLIRDPRDVLVSLYFHKRFRRSESKRYSGEISEFIRSKTGGIESLVAFYNTWAENYHLPRGFLLIRYEDMIIDAKKELDRVLRFMGIDWLPDEILEESVQYGSFENLRSIEASNKLQSGSLQTTDPDNEESFKVRKGKVGGYHDYLNDDDIAYLDGIIKSQLSDYFSFYKH